MSGPHYTMAKSCDHQMVRALATIPRQWHGNFKLNFVWSCFQMYDSKDIHDQALNQKLFITILFMWALELQHKVKWDSLKWKNLEFKGHGPSNPSGIGLRHEQITKFTSMTLIEENYTNHNLRITHPCPHHHFHLLQHHPPTAIAQLASLRKQVQHLTAGIQVLLSFVTSNCNTNNIQWNN